MVAFNNISEDIYDKLEIFCIYNLSELYDNYDSDINSYSDYEDDEYERYMAGEYNNDVFR